MNGVSHLRPRWGAQNIEKRVVVGKILTGNELRVHLIELTNLHFGLEISRGASSPKREASIS